METHIASARVEGLLAFAIIYFVWGSTFLAIRVGVREVPPFLLAGMPFPDRRLILYGWMRVKGTPSPSAREWGSATFLAVLIFVCDYGLLFWAERRVPSGIAAVMMATIPVFMALVGDPHPEDAAAHWRLHGVAGGGWRRDSAGGSHCEFRGYARSTRWARAR